MPLVHFVGVMCTNTTFSIACYFVRAKQTDDYVWTLTELNRLLDYKLQPRVVITDCELALMRAFEAAFPDPLHILYVWHIARNNSARCKHLFPQHDESDRGGFVEWDMFNAR